MAQPVVYADEQLDALLRQRRRARRVERRALKVHYRYCALLSGMAGATWPPHVAVLGLGDGKEVSALARGVRRYRGRELHGFAPKVLVFYWEDGELDALAVCRARRVERPDDLAALVCERYPTILPIHSYGSRTAEGAIWPHALEHLPQGFTVGLLVITDREGSHKTVLAEIAQLASIMDDRTKIVITNARCKEPIALIRALRESGWASVSLNAIGSVVCLERGTTIAIREANPEPEQEAAA